MTQPQEQTGPVTLEKAWQRFLRTLAFTNTQRARDAKRFAQALTRDRKRY